MFEAQRAMGCNNVGVLGCKDKAEQPPILGTTPRPAVPRPEEVESRNRPLSKRCPETRPEACTKEYVPVCAKRDTAVRCVTTPCDSYEWVTYSNTCTACADADVSGFIPGLCEEDDETSNN
jgi:hypothetical protein